MNHTITHRLVDRTALDRVMAAVGMGVVVYAVDVLADHVLGLPTQHPSPGRIDKSSQALCVDAVDTVPHRTEQ
ncbi:hypothetical protein D9M71_766650 [compost metagenome]